MTRDEWPACDDPAAMLRWLAARPGRDRYAGASDRKLRLYGCALVRQVWRLLDAGSRDCVALAERYADGGATRRETEAMWLAHGSDQSPHVAARCLVGSYRAASVAHNVLGHLGWLEARVPAAADLLREVVGDPFRPVTLPEMGSPCPARCSVLPNPPVGYEGVSLRWRQGAGWHPCPECKGSGNVARPCPWLTPTVLAVAQAVYAGRDFTSLPVLADALEEAGAVLGCIHCVDGVWGEYDDDARTPIACSAPSCAILAHLRSPGPHVRGCWALDLVLGRE